MGDPSFLSSIAAVGFLTLAGQGLVVSGWWWGFGARKASARARYARPSHNELLEHLKATNMAVL